MMTHDAKPSRAASIRQLNSPACPNPRVSRVAAIQEAMIGSHDCAKYLEIDTRESIKIVKASKTARSQLIELL